MRNIFTIFAVKVENYNKGAESIFSRDNPCVVVYNIRKMFYGILQKYSDKKRTGKAWTVSLLQDQLNCENSRASESSPLLSNNLLYKLIQVFISYHSISLLHSRSIIPLFVKSTMRVNYPIILVVFHHSPQIMVSLTLPKKPRSLPNKRKPSPYHITPKLTQSTLKYAWMRYYCQISLVLNAWCVSK